jgi:hypothetical protein
LSVLRPGGRKLYGTFVNQANGRSTWKSTLNPSFVQQRLSGPQRKSWQRGDRPFTWGMYLSVCCTINHELEEPRAFGGINHSSRLYSLCIFLAVWFTKLPRHFRLHCVTVPSTSKSCTSEIPNSKSGEYFALFIRNGAITMRGIFFSDSKQL